MCNFKNEIVVKSIKGIPSITRKHMHCLSHDIETFFSSDRLKCMVEVTGSIVIHYYISLVSLCL